MEKPQKNKNIILLTIFLIVVLDLIGFGIIIPILTPLLINSNAVLPSTMPHADRALVLGVLLGSYPLAQFFGAPVLGTLSDQYGRRKLLLLSLIGTMIGFVIFAIGIMTQTLLLLFVGRILAGFTGGNISIANSAIADISSQKDRAKNFGMIGAAFGLGFLIGPFIGGKLSDSTILPWFSFATPIWFAAVLSLINIMMLIWRFPETHHVRSKAHISLTTGIKNLQKAIRNENLRTMFLVVFLYVLGFNFFISFFQVFLVDRFHFTASQIGEFFAFIGIWIAFVQGVLTRVVAKWFRPQKVLTYTLLGLPIAILITLLPNTVFMLYMVQPLVSVFQGLAYPNTTAVVSNLSTQEAQGEILGINQSIQALAMTLPPFIAGFLVGLDITLPIIIGAGCIFIAWLIFIFEVQRKAKATEKM